MNHSFFAAQLLTGDWDTLITVGSQYSPFLSEKEIMMWLADGWMLSYLPDYQRFKIFFCAGLTVTVLSSNTLSAPRGQDQKTAEHLKLVILNLWIKVICNVSPNFHSPQAILLPLSVWDQWQIKNRIKVKGKERLKRLWYKWNSNGARPSEAVETLMKLLCWMEMRACSHYSSAYWTKTISAVGVIMLMGVPWPSLAFRLGCEATVFFVFQLRTQNRN